MKRWKVGLPVALLTSLLLLSACTLPFAAPHPEQPQIDVVVKMLDVDFWQIARQGAEAAAKEFDVSLSFSAPQSEGDIDGQIRMVQDAIQRKASAIVLAATDYERLADVVETASKAHIPVVVIDSSVHSTHVSSIIATDNHDAGTKVGNQLIRFAGSDCDIAVVNFVKGSAPADQREAGLMSVLNRYPNVHVLDTQYCQSDIALAEKQARDLLQKYPQIDAIVGLNAMSVTGVARAVSGLGLAGKVKVVAIDSSVEEIEFIENGVIQSAVVQNPFAMGYLGVKTALSVLKGEKVSATIDTGSTIIDKDNLYTPENQKLLFPFVK